MARRVPGTAALGPHFDVAIMFTATIKRSLSVLVYKLFLRMLLFFYGLELHHLNPDSILQVAIFIILYEGFLGIRPHLNL